MWKSEPIFWGEGEGNISHAGEMHVGKEQGTPAQKKVGGMKKNSKAYKETVSHVAWKRKKGLLQDRTGQGLRMKDIVQKEEKWSIGKGYFSRMKKRMKIGGK